MQQIWYEPGANHLLCEHDGMHYCRLEGRQIVFHTLTIDKALVCWLCECGSH